MVLSSIAGKSVAQSFIYESFRNKIEEKIVSNSSVQLDEEAKKLFEYTKLNLQRMKRVEKTFTVSEELNQILSSIKTPQHWVIITEGWCGDSAQNLPAIAKITSVNPEIELQIIERDQNLEIMDSYLTNGTRSIPILISFDVNGNEIFRWGPRPKEAQQLVTRLKSEGMEHDAFVEQLHLWYAKNKSAALEMELKNLLLSL
ncbi:MAG: thioredoxin family protein [Ignavibacteria bacterium]|nr:thioredoxin family protein [Ignavibacteria bacterium]